MSSHDFSYSVICPACLAQDGNTSSTMGLTLATGKFTCTAENPHEFDVLPGEAAPAAVAEEVAEAKRLEDEPEVEAAPVTQEVKDAEENRLAAISSEIAGAPFIFPPDLEKVAHSGADFSQCCVCRLGDAEGHYCDVHVPVDSVQDVADLAKRLQSRLLLPPPMFKVTPHQRAEIEAAIERGDLKPGKIVFQPGEMDIEPAFNRPVANAVRVGEFASLPGGDILVGLRVSELWVSCMQSEAIGQNQEFMQYVQELFDRALQDYHASAPAPR
jgi:hypothetical protein